MFLNLIIHAYEYINSTDFEILNYNLWLFQLFLVLKHRGFCWERQRGNAGVQQVKPMLCWLLIILVWIERKTLNRNVSRSRYTALYSQPND